MLVLDGGGIGSVLWGVEVLKVGSALVLMARSRVGLVMRLRFKRIVYWGGRLNAQEKGDRQ